MLSDSHEQKKHTKNPQFNQRPRKMLMFFFNQHRRWLKCFRGRPSPGDSVGKHQSQARRRPCAWCSAGQADTSRTDPGPLGQPKSTAAAAPAPASTSACGVLGAPTPHEYTPYKNVGNPTETDRPGVCSPPKPLRRF